MKWRLLKCIFVSVLIITGTGFFEFSDTFFKTKPVSVLLLGGNAMAETNVSDQNRVFHVKQILDGQWPHPVIEVSSNPQGLGVRVVGVDSYSPTPKPANVEAIHMVLAFQLTPEKTREDFAKFKKVDGPWVASNHGSNAATIWTERRGDWIFDAFEDVVFASKADFDRAYAGNDELNKAAEGLFGDKILVVIVEER